MNTSDIVNDFIKNEGDENYLESLYAGEKYKIGFEQKKANKTDGVIFKDGEEIGIMECKRGKCVTYTQQNKITILCQIFGYLYKKFKDAINIPKGYMLEISTDKWNSYVRVTDKIRSFYAKFKKMYAKFYERKIGHVTPSQIWKCKECVEIKNYMLSLKNEIVFKTYKTGEVDYDDFVNEIYNKHLAYA